GPIEVDPLLVLIEGLVTPLEWKLNCGPSRIDLFRDVLSIRANYEAQRGISEILDDLKTIKQRQEQGFVDPPLVVRTRRGTERAVAATAKALTQPWDLPLKEVPLLEAIKAISKQYSVPINLDRQSMAEAGIEPTTPLKFATHEGTLAEVLSPALRAMRLQFTNRFGALYLYPVDSEPDAYVTLYPVADLIQAAEHLGTDAEARNADDLMSFLTNSVARPAYHAAGGAGTILYCSPARAVAITQTAAAHADLARVFDGLRTKLATRAKDLASQVGAEEKDRWIVRIFHLKSAAQAGYVPAATLLALVKSATGEKVWQDPGAVLRADEAPPAESRYISSDGNDPLPPLLTVRQRPAGLTQIQHLLGDLNVLEAPGHDRPAAPVFSGAFSWHKEQPAYVPDPNDPLPPGKKCEGEFCPLPKKK
ncbi:MAG TPA: hypothetical protein VFE24_08540, partial [Pirellulales bacterium]|nr:hypothetical protein [Pirellulales bacterium]